MNLLKTFREIDDDLIGAKTVSSIPNTNQFLANFRPNLSGYSTIISTESIFENLSSVIPQSALMGRIEMCFG